MTVGPRLRARSSRRIVLPLLILLAVLSPFAVEAGNPFGVQGRLPRAVPQGGVFAVTLRPGKRLEEVKGTLDEQPLIFSRVRGGRLQALVGIDLEATGQRRLSLEGRDRKGRLLQREWPIRITPRDFIVQRMTLPEEMVDLDAETAARVAEEASRLGSLWQTVTQERHWRGTFLIPVSPIGPPGGFGNRRIINEQPRAPHAGTDYTAHAGSPVLASNDARVALAEEQFFGGKSVVLDHGAGLYTIYFHLNEFLVHPGDRVRKGQEIGRVGATGRATGPHLHFGVRLQGARIDPAALLRLRLL